MKDMERGLPENREHLLHLLDATQRQYRHIPHDAVIDIAHQCGLPISQVESVIDFYSFFHRTPRGRYDLMFSNCTSCGDLSLMQGLCSRLNCTPGQTRHDERVSIDATSCIGMCDQGPALLVNDHVFTRVSSDKVHDIVEGCRKVFGVHAAQTTQEQLV